jgi:hypothetical protein
MAVPAEGPHADVFMTSVAELSLVGMAVHTGAREALVILPAVRPDMDSVGGADGVVSPLIQ